MLKEILVLDDNEAHESQGHDAVKSFGLACFGGFGGGCIETFLKRIKLLEERIASGELKPGEVGVLTDLFFPVDYWNQKGGELAPLGLLVMSECRRLEIPCVIVTAGYHHGKNYNQICEAGRMLGWPEMIDSGTPDNPEIEATAKNWKKGVEVLLQLVSTNGAG